MVGPLEKPGTSLKAGHYKLYRSPLYCLHPLYWPTFRSVLLFASPTYRWPFQRLLRPERIYEASGLTLSSRPKQPTFLIRSRRANVGCLAEGPGGTRDPPRESSLGLGYPIGLRALIQSL